MHSYTFITNTLNMDSFNYNAWAPLDSPHRSISDVERVVRSSWLSPVNLFSGLTYIGVSRLDSMAIAPRLMVMVAASPPVWTRSAGLSSPSNKAAVSSSVCPGFPSQSRLRETEENLPRVSTTYVRTKISSRPSHPQYTRYYEQISIVRLCCARRRVTHISSQWLQEPMD